MFPGRSGKLEVLDQWGPLENLEGTGSQEDLVLKVKLVIPVSTVLQVKMA